MNSTKVPNFPRKKVYHEKQESDRLCGVHTINSLLQGPFFDPFQLSEIAINLDKMERSLYDPLYSHKQSGNVDLDGNYNIQVLTSALKKHNVDIVPLKNSEAVKFLKEDMDMEALIFNSSTHWYTIRKIDNIWFNLNSTNKTPEIISDFYLSAYIKGTEQIGYSNFLVKNMPKLLPLDAIMYSNLQPLQRLVSIEEIVEAKKKNDERVKNLNDKKKSGEEKKDEEEEDKNKFKAFKGQGVSLGGEGKYISFKMDIIDISIF